LVEQGNGVEQMSQTASVPEKVIVIVTDGWGSSFGGINAFNIDFCLACGRVSGDSYNVICLCPHASDSEIATAASDRLKLIAIPDFDRKESDATTAAAIVALTSIGVRKVELCIGHDVVTGPIAVKLGRHFQAKCAVIHHMSYGSYQGVKTSGQEARVKEDHQKETLRSADIVLAVGPLLQRSASELCSGTPPVHMIVPGLPEIEPASSREGLFRVISFGRLGQEDDRIKQGAMGATAYGTFIHAHSHTKHTQHRFNLFGLNKNDAQSEETKLKEIIHAAAGRVVNVVACPYTENRSALFEAIAANEAALMLSWHEGFGLVGWEAIAAGVPLIVSKASGLFMLLSERPEIFGSDCVFPVDIRGSNTDVPNPDDVKAVAEAIQAIAADQQTALAKATKLRNYLKAHFTWDGCADHALTLCGVHRSPTDSISAAPSSNAIQDAKTHPILFGVPNLPHLFLGRERDIAELKARIGLNNSQDASVKVLTAIRGWPGIGKTSTAAWLAHDPEVRSAFPDGILWTSLGENPNLLGKIAVWGRYFGSAELQHAPSVTDATTILQSLLRGRRFLIIVDDVWSTDHVLPFRAVAQPDCQLLVTTRLPKVAQEIVTRVQDIFNLPVLDHDASLELLRRLAPDVVAANPTECAELVQSFEHLPLAIHVAGRLLAVEFRNGWGVKDLLQDLKSSGNRILSAAAPIDRSDGEELMLPTVQALLLRSTDRLGEIARDKFALLGAFAPKPATFDLNAIQAVWDTTDAKVTIRELVDRGLIEPIEGGRFQMHALLVSHAKSLCAD
jgi:hypothetical protein